MLFFQGVCQRKLDHIQLCVRVPCKHPGSGCPVHGLLAALRALAVMMAVDRRTLQLRTDFVELVAEPRHLFRAVLVAGNDLVDRVDNNGRIIPFLGPPDEFRRQLVHRYGLASQVPDINVLQGRRPHPDGFVDVTEPMQAAGPVQLQVDVHHTAFCTFSAEPRKALRDCNTQLDLEERLSRLAGPCDQHLMTFPEHARDQLAGQFGNIVPGFRETLDVRKAVIDCLDPLVPLFPGALSYVRIDDKLFSAAAFASR